LISPLPPKTGRKKERDEEKKEYLKPGNPYGVERLRISTVDLLVLTYSDQLLFILKMLLAIVTKQASLIRRSTVLSHPSS
jgi:hypothetical protein